MASEDVGRSTNAKGLEAVTLRPGDGHTSEATRPPAPGRLFLHRGHVPGAAPVSWDPGPGRRRTLLLSLSGAQGKRPRQQQGAWGSSGHAGAEGKTCI